MKKALPGEILSLISFAKLRPSLKGKIVATSGGFDPIHPGHISSIQEAKELGDILVVIVNGDWFLKNKKGKEFQDLETRTHIVAAIYGVDFVVPFEIENDTTVNCALEAIKPHVFAKGGDRSDPSKIAELDVCNALKIELVTGVGVEKSWSSSKFLEDWEKYKFTDKRIKLIT